MDHRTTGRKAGLDDSHQDGYVVYITLEKDLIHDAIRNSRAIPDCNTRDRQNDWGVLVNIRIACEHEPQQCPLMFT